MNNGKISMRSARAVHKTVEGTLKGGGPKEGPAYWVYAKSFRRWARKEFKGREDICSPKLRKIVAAGS